MLANQSLRQPDASLVTSSPPARPLPVAPMLATPDPVSVSVVVPLFNEEESIALLHERLTGALRRTGRAYEIIVVDDGSTDSSFRILQQLQQRDSHLRIVRFRRNFGQTAAFSAGFDLAQGDVVVTIDADLQNDPEDIEKLLAKVEEGYDVVSGWRIDRKDRYLDRKLPSQIANRLISSLTGVHLHDYGCSLKAYRAEVVKNIKLYGEMHRFIPALASWIGVNVAEIPVNHAARQFGKSKYGIGRTIRVFLDLLTVKFLLGYSTRPIQIFGLLGIVCLGVGTALGMYLSALRLFMDQALADRPLLLLAILLVVLGVQFITMGLIGELVVRTYYESQNKPIYLVRETLGAEPPGAPPAAPEALIALPVSRGPHQSRAVGAAEDGPPDRSPA